MPADSRIVLLLEMLDQAFDRRAWHGTTLRGALRGVSAAQALWRPGPGRHNVWEYAIHAAYWKYVVRRRLGDEPAGTERAGDFPRTPSNWPAVPGRPDPAAWRRDLSLLIEEHRRLRERVAALSPRRLAQRSPRGAWTLAQEIHGVAAHDLYHTGQIQLVKRLLPARLSEAAGA